MSKWFVYSTQGVSIEPALPSSQDTVTIVYKGLLAKSGATELYAHVGYNGWQDIRDYPMLRTANGFETSVIPPEGAHSVSVCFKDSANNWDNNSGRDYSFEMQVRDFYNDYDPTRDYALNLREEEEKSRRYLNSGYYNLVSHTEEEPALNWAGRNTHKFTHVDFDEPVKYSKEDFDEFANVNYTEDAFDDSVVVSEDIFNELVNYSEDDSDESVKYSKEDFDETAYITW